MCQLNSKCQFFTFASGKCHFSSGDAKKSKQDGHIGGAAMRTGFDPGSHARCANVRCGYDPGTLPCTNTDQQRCITRHGFAFKHGGKQKHEAFKHCKPHFKDKDGRLACPDGGLNPVGVLMVRQSFKGHTAWCQSWDSMQTVRGALTCNGDGSVCTKMQVIKLSGMSNSAGVLVMKRIVCHKSGELRDQCSVYKVGNCFDVKKKIFAGRNGRGSGIWMGTHNYPSAGELETDLQKFAVEVTKQLKEGKDMTCRNTSVGAYQKGTSDYKMGMTLVRTF